MSLRDIVAAIRRRRREPPLPAPAEAQADLVEVFKGERRMELKRDGQTIRRYRVALGFSPERHKEREGDGRTPEGSYTVDARNPQSAFHLSLRVSYPDEPTRRMPRRWASRRAATSTSTASPMAGASFVGHPAKDWTTGCVAVTDAEIREVWSLVPTGARVVIHP